MMAIKATKWMANRSKRMFPSADLFGEVSAQLLECARRGGGVCKKVRCSDAFWSFVTSFLEEDREREVGRWALAR